MDRICGTFNFLCLTKLHPFGTLLQAQTSSLPPQVSQGKNPLHFLANSINMEMAPMF